MSEKMIFELCVRCSTYNQSNYIEEALNGFCMQETNFPFVCCIFDDASTDDTPCVISSYLQKNFNLENNEKVRKEETDDYILTYAQHKTNKNCYFAVLFLKYNHFGKKDRMCYIREWHENAKYVALCEGDDYWTDPFKLQYQYDLLESDKSLGMCYTKVNKYYQEEHRMGSTPFGGNKECYMELLGSNCIPTLSVMYRGFLRNDYVKTINPSIRKWKMGDYPFWLFISHGYKIKFVDRITGVYRVNTSSTSQTHDINKYLSFMKSVESIRDFFIDFYKDDINENALKQIKHNHNLSISNYCLIKFNDRNMALQYMKQMEKKTIVDYVKILILNFDVLAKIYRNKLIR